ncbi:hypothetical protein HPB50_013520 [Hyalomma asiaticum]|uniref:Uncharacterized protein n=1 Tax=Hyalomma asiaticum TaxID=266040 RepID=A0ACB7RKQ2_HYAAI|nr:hypothetical protein HPB50_013520 [Hyalomma asiaticum]
MQCSGLKLARYRGCYVFGGWTTAGPGNRRLEQCQEDKSQYAANRRRASADVVSDGKKTPENDRKVLSSPSSADSPFVGSPVLDIAVTNGSPRAVEAKRPHLCRLCNVCRKIAGLSPRKHHHGRKRRRGHRHGQEQQPARADSASTALGVRDVVKPVPLDEPFDLSIRKFSERPPGVASDIAETSFSPGGPSQPSATSSMSPSSPLLPEAAALPAAPAVDGRATNAVAAAAEPEQPCRVNQDRQVAKTPVKASFAADIGGFDGDERCKRDRSARRKRRRPSKRQQDNANESPSANSLPPMMSPGAATVLNIDAALLPKGPQTRLPDSLPMGRFQLMILACAQLSAAVDAYQILSARLLAPTVDHWCRPPAEYSHMSAEIWKNASVPLGSNGRYNQCAVYEQARIFSGEFSLAPFGPQHSGLSLEPQRPTVPCHSWDYDLPPGVQTMVSRWDLVCDYAWQVTFARIYHIISSFVMLPLAGQLSDKVGRRVVINFCVILAMCAGLAVAYAESFVVFVASRIFVSASASTLRINTLILLFEVVTPSYRDLYCCLVQLGHIVGSIVAASLEGGVVDVRIVEVVGIMPTSLLVFCFYAAEESPMWLLATWNFAKAKKVLLWMSRVNGVAVAIDIPDLSQHHRAKRTEEVRAVYRVSVLDMLTNETVRRRVGSMMCVWFCPALRDARSVATHAAPQRRLAGAHSRGATGGGAAGGLHAAARLQSQSSFGDVRRSIQLLFVQPRVPDTLGSAQEQKRDDAVLRADTVRTEHDLHGGDPVQPRDVPYSA